MEQLLKKIEEYRYIMHEVATKKDFSDPEVVLISNKLDELINQYNRLRYY
ncbi:MAG: aspartyl-phosphate phosphatase Spo0E family protein [Firmicutes bacterium]|nr:aspartyl-phosphate phosphatase Spo0E family protein [Bacillota bacterium]